MMQCPKCKAPMERVDFSGIEIDRCSKCHGLWFGAMEKDRLVEMSGSEKIDDGDAGVGRGYDRVGDIVCPDCQTRMIRMVDAAQPHIRYESCKVCNGTFLDAGEFRDLKEHTFLDFFRDLFARERR